MANTTALERYNAAALKTSAEVIRCYSTSFGLACRLLDGPTRARIEAVYALVRVADEVVDGPAAAAGLDAGQVEATLDALERETETALATGYSANLVVHAFAVTARATGIGMDLTRPFFASMRADITQREHTPESFSRYVYGSAEVVGLMCVKAFLAGRPTDAAQEEILADGARHLGAAFQKINFLRDLAEDFSTLGRSYFPGIRPGSFTEQDKHRLLDDIDEDLRISLASLPGLPPAPRRAVALAQALFTELALRLRRTPAEELLRARIRVPNAVKLRILARTLAGSSAPETQLKERTP
ncbi:phytoene/squalene synthase family protein [Arthrobacter sp. MSA 4-2]|uniref:phytoene/squalene synthase family protein n=1 Tax=Arthrobacter sp. MSA 4-2 TaxID=2794349 RepID=UPI0018E8F45F|nr:phytoene/squalene synthase family protein [Arthrobacter sp. MSA 4-2]MBJ2120458.1 phytoene/squalene synthase family protein [Arthrobacter sp. MSA 4-2]